MYIQITSNDTPFQIPLMTKKPANIQVLMKDFNNNSSTSFDKLNSLQYNSSYDYYLLREKETLGEQYRDKDNQYIKISQNDSLGGKSIVQEQLRDVQSQKCCLGDSISPKNKEPKINLEFLKCYWKKDYRKLAKIIQMNKLKNQKELPFLVTSYSKNLSAEQRIFPQQQRPSLEERTLNIKPQKYDPFINARNGQQIISKRSSELDLSYAKFKENIIITKKKIEDEKTSTIKLKTEVFELQTPKDSPAPYITPQLVSQTKTSKHGLNLKQNIKKNQYKNLDAMLEQNNIFYLKYGQEKKKQQQNSKELKNFIEVSSQARSITQNVDESISSDQHKKKTKIRSNFVKFQEPKDKIFLSPRKPTLPLALSPIYEFQMRAGQLSPHNGIIQAGSESDQDVETETQENQIQNSIIGTYIIQKIQRQKRQAIIPNLVLVIHIEGVLAFTNDSYFGFQTDHPNFQFFTETINKMFHQIDSLSSQKVIYVYKSMKEVLLSLSRAYLIVLVIRKDKIKFFNAICKYLQDQQIFYDGLYFQEDGQYYESFITDYSPIITDFYLSSPKLLVTVNPIDIDEVKDLYSKKHPRKSSKLYGSYLTNKADQFIQYAKVLKQSEFGFESSSLFLGAFPLATLCSSNNTRSLLIPKINYRRILTMLRSNMSVPTLEKLEQICIAIMSDYSFLNLLYNYKQNLFRCSFNNMFELIHAKNKQIRYRDQILITKLKNLFKKAAKDLENEQETYTQEQGEQVMVESKKQLFANFQGKLQKIMRKNRSQTTTIINNEELKLDDVSLKVQGLIEEMYSRNKGILKSIIKHRIKVKQRLQTYECENLNIPQQKNNTIQELQFCNQLSEHMLFCVNIC